MKLSKATRNEFASQSSGTYYPTKGDAVAAFNDVLEPLGLLLDPKTTTQLYNDEGRATPAVVRLDDETTEEGLAVLTWYRMPSGRWEVVGYLA